MPKAITRYMILLIVVAGASLAVMPLSAPAAPNAATITLVTPSGSSASACGTIPIEIWVNDVTNLYGVDVRLAFDPNQIEVQDSELSTTGVQVEKDLTNFYPDFTIRNIVDNFTGTIWYAANQNAPRPAFTGSDKIATIYVKVKTSGSLNLNFTYTKLSNSSGVEIPATASNTTLSGSNPVVSTLSITRMNTTDVQLSWTAVTGAANYHLYRSDKPYFYPADPALISTTNLSYTNAGVLGTTTTINTNYFYSVRVECSGGQKGPGSNQVGKFEYQLYETTGTDFNWIGLPLVVSGVSTSVNLRDHIQANSNAAVTVLSISRWNASGQNFTISGAPFWNSFPVLSRFAYRMSLDIPGVSGTSGSVVWAQVGGLPVITNDYYTLYESSGTDFNWILQPLEKHTLTDTNAIANDIEFNASGSVGVLTISRWNAASQSYSTYNRTMSFTNFASRFGYPYRVQVNVNNGTTVTWP